MEGQVNEIHEREENKLNKNYYIIHYYDPDLEENKFFEDPNLYSSEEEAMKHVKKDIYSQIEEFPYSNTSLFSMIFKALCAPSDCYTCSYRGKCYIKDSSNKMFEDLSEQEQLEICASLARQYIDSRQ